MQFKKCQQAFWFFYTQPDEIYYQTGDASTISMPLAIGQLFHNGAQILFEKLDCDNPNLSVEDIRSCMPNIAEEEFVKVNEWYDWLAKIEHERYLSTDKGLFKPFAQEYQVDHADTINWVGHIDRIDDKGDHYQIVEYKTGVSYDPSKPYSLTAIRAELGFYAISLGDTLGKPVKSWKLINPTLQVVYEEDFKPITLRAVRATYNKIVDLIRTNGPFKKNIDMLCQWCDFATECLYEEQIDFQKDIDMEVIEK